MSHGASKRNSSFGDWESPSIMHAPRCTTRYNNFDSCLLATQQFSVGNFVFIELTNELCKRSKPEYDCAGSVWVLLTTPNTEVVQKGNFN